MVKIFDPNGREITVGADVEGGGRVVGITEPEGDYNAYGRAVIFGPYVKVLYPGLGEDMHVCTPEGWTYEEFVCDDVVLS